MIDKQTLINNENVLFAYSISPELTGGSYEPFNIIIIKDEYDAPKEYHDEKLFTMSEWFKLVEDCELFPWMCACIKPKYLIKEHVKILMHSDPYKLRCNIDAYVHELRDAWDDASEVERDRLKSLIYSMTLYASQIIEYHKIINFKAATKFTVPDEKDEYFTYYEKNVYPYVKVPTQGMLDKVRKEELQRKIGDNGRIIG